MCCTKTVTQKTSGSGLKRTMKNSKNQIWQPTLPPKHAQKEKIFGEIAKTGAFIYQIGESEILRVPSKEVPLNEISSGIFREKLGYLKECFFKFRELTGMGKGIAAVQVGIAQRFMLLFMPDLPGEIVTVINPRVTNVSQKRYFHPEMCMSAAPISVPLIRPAWIEFTYLDEEGNQQEWRIKDDTDEGKTYNRVAQHEIDHLDGIINIDRVEAKTLGFELGGELYKKTPYEEVS